MKSTRWSEEGFQSGCFAKFDLADNVGTFPCVTKLFYQASYFTPGNVSPGYVEVNSAPAFWINQSLIKRYGNSGYGGINDSTGQGIVDTVNWEEDRDQNSDGIIDEEWITPAYTPNRQHTFSPPVQIEGDAHRIDNAAVNSGNYSNIIKGFNTTTSYNSIQWGAPIVYDGVGPNANHITASSLKNLFVIQDVLINDLGTRDYYANVAGRVKSDTISNSGTIIDVEYAYEMLSFTVYTSDVIHNLMYGDKIYIEIIDPDGNIYYNQRTVSSTHWYGDYKKFTVLPNTWHEEIFGAPTANQFDGWQGTWEEVNSAPMSRLEDIMQDILVNELEFEQTIPKNSIHSDWKFDFTVNKQLEVKQIFDGLFKSSLAIPSYDNFGQFKLIPLHQIVDGVQFNTIKSTDLINYSFNLSKLDNVYNQVNVKYKKNYASGELDKETGYSLKDLDGNIYQTYDAVTQHIYTNPANHYNIDYYGLTDIEARLEVETEYIRDDDTARKLQKRLVSYYANQHLIVKLDLPVSYMGVEVGDYIKFDELLGGSFVFGTDYTKAHVKNGQYIYPLFFVTKVIKTIEKTKVEAIQVHRGEYGSPDTYDDTGEHLVDGGGNNGQGDFNIPDPGDNPNYSDENINAEEYEEGTFNVTQGDNAIVNNGMVTYTVATNTVLDWDYKIWPSNVYTEDNEPIYWVDDAGEMQSISTGNYNEVNSSLINDFFNITKNVSELAYNYNGSLQITQKYAIVKEDGTPYRFTDNARLDVGIKIFTQDEGYSAYPSIFIQKAEALWNSILGDVNQDGVINVLDVVRLVNIVLAGYETADDDEALAGDMNEDGIINVQDVVILVNIVLGGG